MLKGKERKRGEYSAGEGSLQLVIGGVILQREGRKKKKEKAPIGKADKRWGNRWLRKGWKKNRSMYLGRSGRPKKERPREGHSPARSKREPLQLQMNKGKKNQNPL